MFVFIIIKKINLLNLPLLFRYPMKTLEPGQSLIKELIKDVVNILEGGMSFSISAKNLLPNKLSKQEIIQENCKVLTFFLFYDTIF